MTTPKQIDRKRPADFAQPLNNDSNKVMKGLGVSGGIAIGQVVALERLSAEIYPQRILKPQEVPGELRRFDPGPGREGSAQTSQKDDRAGPSIAESSLYSRHPYPASRRPNVFPGHQGRHRVRETERGMGPVEKSSQSRRPSTPSRTNIYGNGHGTSISSVSGPENLMGSFERGRSVCFRQIQ